MIEPRNGLFEILDRINKRPELTQLGARPQMPQNLFDAAQQPIEEKTQILKEPIGREQPPGRSDGNVGELGAAMAASGVQGALGGLLGGQDVLKSMAQYGLNPGMVGANLAANAVTKNYGFDQSPKGWANKLGTLAGTALAGPVGGIAGGLLGGIAYDAIGDWRNTRQHEQSLDYMEDNIPGYFAPKAATTEMKRANLFDSAWQDIHSPELTDAQNAELNAMQKRDFELFNTPLWGGMNQDTWSAIDSTIGDVNSYGGGREGGGRDGSGTGTGSDASGQGAGGGGGVERASRTA